MKWPVLVPKSVCKTDIALSFEREGVNKYGEPLPEIVKTAKCNYQDKAKKIMTDQKKLTEVTGTALFSGDICPELPVITHGTAVIFGIKRQIIEGRKARNPDGTVNYTELYIK